MSKQVQELERWTGVAVFERVRKRLSLTPAGQRYEAAIRPLLAQIEAATLELITSGDGGGALHLSTLPTFGSKWLIPRLPAFARLHPQIDLRFVPYVQGYDFHRPDDRKTSPGMRCCSTYRCRKPGRVGVRSIKSKASTH